MEIQSRRFASQLNVQVEEAEGIRNPPPISSHNRQMKNRHREVKKLAQGHTADKWQIRILSASQGQALGHLLAEVTLLSNLAFQSYCLSKGVVQRAEVTGIYLLCEREKTK